MYFILKMKKRTQICFKQIFIVRFVLTRESYCLAGQIDARKYQGQLERIGEQRLPGYEK